MAVITYKIVQWDNLRPEPMADLWKVFWAGVIIVFPVAFVEVFVSAFFAGMGFSGKAMVLINSFIVYGLIEEYAKMRIVMRKIYSEASFDEHMDGIVYAVMASMGFAFLENVFYVLQHGVVVGVLRCITAVPMHAMTTGIMGYFIGLSIFEPRADRRQSIIYKGLAIAVFIHGAYDYFCLTPGLFWLIIPLLFVVYKYLRDLMDTARRHDLEIMRRREQLDGLSPEERAEAAMADATYNHPGGPVPSGGSSFDAPPSPEALDRASAPYGSAEAGFAERTGSAPSAPADDIASTPAFTMFCPQCGAENPEANSYCSNCSARLHS